jgi:AcrR family transcriptional regulator
MKTLYDRFGSKDKLIDAYLERRNRTWHLFLDEQLERHRPRTPEKVILALFAALTDWIAESKRGVVASSTPVSSWRRPTTLRCR